MSFYLRHSFFYLSLACKSPLGDSLRPLFSVLKDRGLMYLELKQKESS